MDLELTLKEVINILANCEIIGGSKKYNEYGRACIYVKNGNKYWWINLQYGHKFSIENHEKWSEDFDWSLLSEFEETFKE